MGDADAILWGEAETPYVLRLTLRGRMRAQDASGEDVLPRVRKTRAVLAILALAAPAPVLRDQLATLLWSQRDREQARGSLRQCVHELQEVLASVAPDLLIADRMHLSLRDRNVWIDARKPQPHAAHAVLLEDLAGLDPAFDRWLLEQRRRQTRGAAAAAETMLEASIGIGEDPRRAILAAEQLLAIDRTHEAAWRALMTAYATCGERAASLNAYERCAIALAEAADITPSPQTQALLAQIRGGTIETADHSSSPASPAYRPADRARYRGGRVGARLGVMPFRSLGSTQEDPLSLGLAEEITAALSRFRWFYLIASPSLANLAGEAQTTGERWRALDLDFLLDGTVQRGQDRVRVRARLLDLHAGGEVIWTNSFDRRGEDLLTLQDEIAAETVARIDPALMQREGSRAASGPPSSSTAYDLVLRSIPALYRLQEHSFRAAGETLGEAVALAPDYAAAHAWFACWHIFLVGQNWAHNPAAAMARAGDLADRAVMLDPSDARALTLSGHVHAFLHERVDEAIDLHDRALALNPNLPMAWAFSGLAHSYAGMHEDALLRIENALRLSPFDPHAFFFEMAKMLPNLVSGSFERVVQLGKHSIALNPSCTSTYKLLLSACGHLGREAECRALGQRLLQLEPGFRVSAAVRRSCLQRPSDRDVYAQGLRRAGLPE